MDQTKEHSVSAYIVQGPIWVDHYGELRAQFEIETGYDERKWVEVSAQEARNIRLFWSPGRVTIPVLPED